MAMYCEPLGDPYVLYDPTVLDEGAARYVGLVRGNGPRRICFQHGTPHPSYVFLTAAEARALASALENAAIRAEEPER